MKRNAVLRQVMLKQILDVFRKTNMIYARSQLYGLIKRTTNKNSIKAFFSSLRLFQ